jgi:twitching motility protein PilT
MDDNLDLPETSDLRRALAEAVQQGASDLHVVVGHQPTMRLHGRLRELEGAILTDQVATSALRAFCPPQFWQKFEREHNTDFALELDFGGAKRRLRANYFLSSAGIGACFRIIPSEIPEFNWAGFPRPLAQRLAHFRNGLVLISGVSGAGKTTTLAMLINLLAQEGDYRIITLEEPIE